MTELRFGIGDNDKDRLVNFVKEIESFINEIIEEDRGKNLYFITELVEPMKAAWDMRERHFKEIYSCIENVNNNELTKHGLQGSELEFKLSVINHLWSKFITLKALPEGKTKKRYAPIKPLYFKKYIGFIPYILYLRWLLKRLLESIDKLLTSLLDAIGASGAVSEFKDFLESSIDIDNFYEDYA